MELSSKIYLISFNNIKIRDFILPDDFDEWEIKKRKIFILDNYKNYEYELSTEQFLLNININAARLSKNINKTVINKVIRIPDCIVYKPIEEMLYPEKHIYKLSNKKYLFKYNVGELQTKLKQKDKEVLNIIEKDDLDYINIITQEKTEYLVFSEFDSDNDIYGFSYKKNENLNSTYVVTFSREIKNKRKVYSE